MVFTTIGKGLNMDAFSISNISLEKGRKPAHIGEIRNWQGQKFQKQGNGSWKLIVENKDKTNQLLLKANLNAIGQRYRIPLGEPMTFDEADGMKTNPNYFKNDSYKTNCQTCVVVYELRRRGFDISAKRKDANLWNQTRTARESNWCFNDTEREKITQSQSLDDYLSNIENLTKEEGRYHIDFGFWSSYNSRKYFHVVTLERTKGELFLYDPQNGKKSNIRDYFTGYSLIIGHQGNLIKVSDKTFNIEHLDGLFDLRGKARLNDKGQVVQPKPKEDKPKQPTTREKFVDAIADERYGSRGLIIKNPNKNEDIKNFILEGKDVAVFFKNKDLILDSLNFEDYLRKSDWYKLPWSSRGQNVYSYNYGEGSNKIHVRTEGYLHAVYDRIKEKIQ